MKAKLRIKCRNCGNWNTIEVKKIFLNSDTSESKLKVFLPAYMPMNTEQCARCNQVIARERGIIGKKKN